MKPTPLARLHLALTAYRVALRAERRARHDCLGTWAAVDDAVDATDLAARKVAKIAARMYPAGRR
jgi:hypothetical protein